VAAGHTAFYIASDEAAAGAAFAQRIRQLGGSVVNEALPSTAALSLGEAAMLDLFRLGACKAIMLVARYSGFTFAAALLQTHR
jgi:hypothetical protein